MAANRDSKACQHLFPNAVKVVTTQIERDSTGLTGPQKTALISGWAFIKKDILIHSKNMFVSFLDKYPKYLKYFDFSDDAEKKSLFDNRSLHAHSLNVMNAIGTLIEFGLHDSILFECTMKKIVRKHSARSVYRDDARNLTDALKIYILDVMENQSTQTFEEAVESFCIRLVSGFEISPNEPSSPSS